MELKPINFFFAASTVLFCYSASYGQPAIKIVQPYENQRVPYVTSSFVYGSVVPATATLMINGISVKPYRNGGFLTMVPFQEGSFQIQAVADDGVSTTTLTRTIQVAYAPASFSLTHSKIEPIVPRNRLVMRIDDLLDVAFQGAPSGTASFKFEGKISEYPMREQVGAIQGIYKGVYRIQSDDKFDNADIVFYLKRSDGKLIKQKSVSTLTIQRRTIPRYIELKEKTTLLTGPSTDLGYSMFLLDGVRLEVTGESGDFYHVFLGAMDDGWIKKSSALELPAGTAPPRSISRNIRINATPESTIVELPLAYRHAHRVEELTDPDRLRLTLFGVIADTDRIRFKSKFSAIKDVDWVQNNADTYTLDLKLKRQVGWGYEVRYEGSKLVLEIRHHPFLGGAKGLRGLRVAVDAGHSNQSYGTIGPWGNTEASVNLLFANVLKKELERRGADVFMVQDGTKDPSLQDRIDQAWAAKSHLYISLHCDATEEGVDPREQEGFSVHYYQAQSQPLAEDIHRFYGESSRVRDQGLWRSNLAVCRMTQMPSILLELGFLMIPQSEEKLLSPSFQQNVANIISNAILNLVNKTAP